ncbi:MAG: OmpA family protein [Pseudomonadota bacterium]
MAGALSDDRIFVTIVGHTGSAGDAAANLSLSEARAALAADMAEALGIAPERITARGVGGGAPLDKQTNENARAYQSRLARIDVTLQLRR